MSTSSILTTMQLDRSLFSDDPAGALVEFLLASAELILGLDCPSKMQKTKCGTLDKHSGCQVMAQKCF